MTTQDQSLTRQAAAGAAAPPAVQRVLRAAWWLGAAVLTVAVVVAMDRVAWVDALAGSTRSGLRIASGAALVALAGLLDPWAGPESRRD